VLPNFVEDLIEIFFNVFFLRHRDVCYLRMS
jgi:hypothetical protein